MSLSSSSGAARSDASAPVLPTAPTQAIVVHPYPTVNVKTHVPIELDLRLLNYNIWNTFFTAMCGKFSLLGHIDGTITTRLTHPDACVRS